MKFEDVHEKYNAPGGFSSTNEEPDIERLLLRGRTIKRAAAIASGGEVSFFLLLPRVLKELVCVDHSYASLAAFYVKVLLLESIGPAALKQLLVYEPPAKWLEAIDRVSPQVPEALRKHLSGPYVTIRAASEHVNLRREWFYVPLKTLAAAARKLDRLTLIHGDLSDLKDRGPFDFLYLSNAFEHVGRENKRPAQSTLDPLLTPDALILTANKPTTYGIYPNNSSPVTWSEVKNFKGVRTAWHYYLFTKAAPQPPKEKP